METRFGTDGIRATRSARQNWQSVLTPDILSVLLVAPEKNVGAHPLALRGAPQGK